MLSFLPSMIVLGMSMLVALFLALNRQSPPDNVAGRVAVSRALAVAVAIQSVHFAEEAATGFHERLGILLNLPGMPISSFVIFNLIWIGIWVASIPGLRSSHAAAFFAAWFLAIAGTINGIAHPLLAIAAGGYFPGLVSSPFVGVASIWLGLQLFRATENTVAK